jgi:hypothetical protein
MNLQHDRLLQAEILIKIRVTKGKIDKLLNDSYPTNGPNSILVLSGRILDSIIKRYKSYSSTQLIFIKTGLLDFIIQLISQIEYSTIKNVTWSIIPAYDKLFKSLFPNTEYIIMSQWEQSYGIFTINLIEKFKYFITQPNMVFDADKHFDENINELLEKFPANIYLIMYSRLEKLSGLHLALLGHEIGHIFAIKWMAEEFQSISQGADLPNRLREIIDTEIKKTALENGLFRDIFNKQRLGIYVNLIKMNYSELISDLFGCALFGHTYIVAVYLYAAINGDLDKSNWDKGYLSWRFRLQNCQNFISYVFQGNKALEHSLFLYDDILDIIKGSLSDNQKHDVCTLLIDAFKTKQEEIYETVIEYAGNELFLNKVNDEEIEAALERLKNSIIPNAMNRDGVEYPIDIRNVLYAIWLFSYNDNSNDLFEYADQIQFYNLLGIKGIELSVEQRNYNDFSKR